MTILSVKTVVECDECGAQFTVHLDETNEGLPGWCVFDLAVDAVRGGLMTSVQNDKHLCRDCTAVADRAPKNLQTEGAMATDEPDTNMDYTASRQPSVPPGEPYYTEWSVTVPEEQKGSADGI